MGRKRNESNIKRKIANACGYPWDWVYMLDVERIKLQSMLNYFETSNIVACADIIRRDIRLCLSLIDIIKKEGSNDESLYYIGYLNTKNSKRFLPNVDFDVNNKPYIITMLRYEKAWHLYNLIRMYKMRNWWD